MRVILLCLLLCMGAAAEPDTDPRNASLKVIRFNVVPSYANITVVTEGLPNAFPAGRPQSVHQSGNQFTIQISAPGWESTEEIVYWNQVIDRWPSRGSFVLRPISWKARLELMPRWPLLLLALLPFAVWKRRAHSSGPAAPPESMRTGTPWELRPGDEVDGYVVEEKLGEGASGVVYRVHYRGEVLALKLLKPQVSSHESMARFRRELKVLTRLRHPNIPYLAGFGEYMGMTYLVMELLGSRTLEDELNEGPLSEPRARGVLRQLAHALSVCHEAGVLHRDVKPANVVCECDGRVRLTDFGLARQTDASTLTQEGSILGTPNYMPPEVVQGEPATELSDQYSLGCVAYHLLSGKPPYEGENPVAVLLLHLQGGAVLTADVSPELKAIVERMMAVRPDERFPNMRALLSAL